MESRSPSRHTSAWLARKPPIEVDEDDRDSELARLRERLKFYESFDSLIQENVSRAGELLRHAATMRETAEQSLADARQEIEDSRLHERQELRAMLSGLLDEVTTTQVQVERLARRVADALDDLESTLPAAGEFESLPTFASMPVALHAPAIAQPLDPTPEEIGPEDPATLAAALAAASAPPVIEAAVAAAEAAEPVELSDAFSARPELVEPAAPIEPELAATPVEVTATGDVDSLEAGYAAAAFAVESPPGAITPDPEPVPHVNAHSVTAELAVGEREEIAEPEAESPIAIDATKTPPPENTETGSPDTTLEMEVEQTPVAPVATAVNSEEDAAWSVREEELLVSAAVTQGATWLNPDVLEHQEATGEHGASSPQVDEEAVMADLAEPVSGALKAAIAPATAAEDVLDGLVALTDESAKHEVAGVVVAGAAAPVEDLASEQVAVSLDTPSPEVELPGEAEPVPSHELVVAEATIAEAITVAETVPAIAEEPLAAEAPATQVDAAPIAQEPGAGDAPPLAASPTVEPPPVRTGTGRLPWIPEDIRPFSTEGLGTAYRRPPGTGELRMPEPSPRPAAKPGTGLLSAARGASTVVLVHGVPRATTALSLKRYLEGLPHVSSVEPREYAEGVLRLHVVGERHIQIDELRGWADGSDLQPVHVREDLLEVRLPT